MLHDLKITIKCYKCNNFKIIENSNKDSLYIEQINYDEITKIYSDLICSNCRTKNPDIVKDNKYSLVNNPPKICSIESCRNPILIPRLKILDNKTNICFLCASGKNNYSNTQMILVEDYESKRITELKKLKKKCSIMNNIMEFTICKNSQIRLIAKLDKAPYFEGVKSILGENNILFDRHYDSIEKILTNNEKFKKIISSELIFF